MARTPSHPPRSRAAALAHPPADRTG
jgi:hypothetical protein